MNPQDDNLSILHDHEHLEAESLECHQRFKDKHSDSKTSCHWRVVEMQADEAVYALTISTESKGFLSLLTLGVQGRRHDVVIEELPPGVELARFVKGHLTPLEDLESRTNVPIPSCVVSPTALSGGRFPAKLDSIWFVKVPGACHLTILSKQIIHQAKDGDGGDYWDKTIVTGHANLPPPPTGGGNTGNN